MKPDISDAIGSLGYKSSFGIKDDKICDWDLCEIKTGETQPTQSELDAKLVELQAEYDAQEYARNRATEYPALAEQLDEIYHKGIDSWKAVIKVTKDKYPKG